MKNLKSNRIYLREAEETDTAFFLELMNMPGWLEHIGDRNIKTETDALGYIQKSLLDSYKTNGFGLYVMCLNESHEPIGLCGLVKRDTLDLPDLGFGILPAYEGKGYVREGSEITLEFAKKELKMDTILAITNPTNKRSQNLLERLGFSVVPKTNYDAEGEVLVTYSLCLTDLNI